MNKLFIGLALGGALLAGFFIFGTNQAPAGGYLVPVGQQTRTQVSCGGSLSGATTSVWTAGSNNQVAYLDNLGNGHIYFGFGQNATNTGGFHLYPSSSPAGPASRMVVDASMLGKAANCVASEATSTLNIYAY